MILEWWSPLWSPSLRSSSLMQYIKKHDFKVFGYYRIVLGVIVFLYFGIVALLA